eukprot:m51a1_g12200 hypothetical protein (829) ;mRNA; f:50206-53266
MVPAQAAASADLADVQPQLSADVKFRGVDTGAPQPAVFEDLVDLRPEMSVGEMFRGVGEGAPRAAGFEELVDLQPELFADEGFRGVGAGSPWAAAVVEESVAEGTAVVTEYRPGLTVAEQQYGRAVAGVSPGPFVLEAPAAEPAEGEQTLEQVAELILAAEAASAGVAAALPVPAVRAEEEAEGLAECEVPETPFAEPLVPALPVPAFRETLEGEHHERVVTEYRPGLSVAEQQYERQVVGASPGPMVIESVEDGPADEEPLEGLAQRMLSGEGPEGQQPPGPAAPAQRPMDGTGPQEKRSGGGATLEQRPEAGTAAGQPEEAAEQPPEETGYVAISVCESETSICEPAEQTPQSAQRLSVPEPQPRSVGYWKIDAFFSPRSRQKALEEGLSAATPAVPAEPVVCAAEPERVPVSPLTLAGRTPESASAQRSPATPMSPALQPVEEVRDQLRRIVELEDALRDERRLRQDASDRLWAQQKVAGELAERAALLAEERDAAVALQLRLQADLSAASSVIAQMSEWEAVVRRSAAMSDYAANAAERQRARESGEKAAALTDLSSERKKLGRLSRERNAIAAELESERLQREEVSREKGELETRLEAEQKRLGEALKEMSSLTARLKKAHDAAEAIVAARKDAELRAERAAAESAEAARRAAEREAELARERQRAAELERVAEQARPVVAVLEKLRSHVESFDIKLVQGSPQSTPQPTSPVTSANPTSPSAQTQAPLHTLRVGEQWSMTDSMRFVWAVHRMPWGPARTAWCESVGLTEGFLASASAPELRAAARNVGVLVGPDATPEGVRQQLRFVLGSAGPESAPSRPLIA